MVREPGVDLRPFDPTTVSADALLTGDIDGSLAEAGVTPDDRLDIDPIHGKAWPRLLAEIRTAASWAVDALAPVGLWRPSDLVSGYGFQDVEAGLVLLDLDERAVGGLMDADLAIDTRHQGQGLGKELVLEKLIHDGGLPTWNHDRCGYSPAGAATVRAARDLAHDRALFARKAARAVVANLAVVADTESDDVADPGQLAADLALPGVTNRTALVTAVIQAHGYDDGITRLEDAVSARFAAARRQRTMGAVL